MNVLTRSYHPSRTGANTNETVLNPSRVASNVLIKSHSLVFHDPPRVDDDPRLEAQPLYVANLKMNKDGRAHDVVFVATMNNTVFAFDVADGTILWQTSLGSAITPKLTPHPGVSDGERDRRA